jgi:hypothetical protein
MPEQPDTRISLDVIVELVRANSFVAFVQQTGGGTATIYASRTADEHGYPARPSTDAEAEVAAGPGWFEPRWGSGGPGTAYHAFGDVKDFNIGPGGGEGMDGVTTATLADDESTLAAEIITRLRELEPRPRCLVQAYSWSREQCQNLVTWNLAGKLADGTYCRAQSACDDHLAVIATEFYEGGDVANFGDDDFVQLRPWAANLPEID